MTVFQFPSPYGVTVIKSELREYDARYIDRFPSPYGVTVIKSFNPLIVLILHPFVSVPLRGNGN